jgi:hypothetical protein
MMIIVYMCKKHVCNICFAWACFIKITMVILIKHLLIYGVNVLIGKYY